MVQSVKPFFMFQSGNAEEAMKFYAALFPDAQITRADKYAAGEPAPEGTLKHGEITIAGQTIRMFDSPVKHAFGFTPAISLFVECESEVELRRLTEALREGGRDYMPIGAYGFSTLFAWVGDRFDITWQLNLA